MNTGLMILAVAATSGLAMANTIDARYMHVAGSNNAATLRVGGQTFYAGHMVHEMTSGPRSGTRFSTFCIELSEAASSNDVVYQIMDLADAPAPGQPYGQAIADNINAVIANAVALGWIDSQLQADTQQTNYLSRMGAIQAAVWEAIGGDIKLKSGQTSSGLRDAYAVLMNEQTFDDSARIVGLKAMTNSGQQDMLIVVPLPPAALAGLGMLVGIGGIRSVRRRRAC
jgi:hypothetical protein